MEVKIIRSARRKRTVSAHIEGDNLIIQAPAGLPEPDLNRIIDQLKGKLERRRQHNASRADDALMARAHALNHRYFAGRLPIVSVCWVSNQSRRFGSCTTARGTIRISDRLMKAPNWVIDYVLMHELAHLVEPNHSKKFWTLVNRYPKAERARGFLMAFGMLEDDDEETPF